MTQTTEDSARHDRRADATALGKVARVRETSVGSHHCGRGGRFGTWDFRLTSREVDPADHRGDLSDEV